MCQVNTEHLKLTEGSMSTKFKKEKVERDVGRAGSVRLASV